MDELRIQVIDPIRPPEPGSLEEALLVGGVCLYEEMTREEFKRRYPDYFSPPAD